MAKSNRVKDFRSWVQERWMEHKDELDGLGIQCDYDVRHYFNKYKYWLKREYQHWCRK